MTESTMMSDKDGLELFLGDVVRHTPEKSFNPEVHGAWVEYEIGKGAGGYVLLYIRSEKGCKLPFGYTATFINQFKADDMDLKTLIWAEEPVRHEALVKVDDSMTHDERLGLFQKAVMARRTSS